ncbi:hypothetical protein HY041_03335 [Candidatus Roizmanbacteria bacterium]|nr:hypothetical protein [Candidatus Roizmanbacteria bacterium]
MGKSSKETGLSLDISYRTVEKHLEILKEKLNCTSKNQLKELFMSSDLKILFE